MQAYRKVEGDSTLFLLSEVKLEYREALRHLYFREKDGIFSKSFPSDSPHLDRCFENFERHIEEIILQMSGVNPVPWKQALEELLKAMDRSEIDWWLSGSSALAARGIDITPHDIDVITDKAGAIAIGELLQENLFEPVVSTDGWICRIFGKAFLHAVIDIAGDVFPEVDTPDTSDFGPAAAKDLQRLDWHGYSIRVPALRLQLEVSERRGLTSRTNKISAFLRKRGMAR